MTTSRVSRPDWSMSLLTDVREGALEPEYLTPGSDHRRRRPLRLVVVVVLVALLVVAGLRTTRTAVDVEAERDELIALVEAEEVRLLELRDEVTALENEIRVLSDVAVADPERQQELARLEPATGAVPVVGPGVVILADDAPDSGGTESLVLDSDLSQLVNGLWQAGAEAISINGRRVTNATPIRSAGAAITVDYVSLSPPYRVEAIGDPSVMQARFALTAAASWWFHISRNYGVAFEVRAADAELELPAVPRMQLHHARKGE